MDKKKDRESNIELLRILAMIGVILLHYNNPTIGGGLSFVKSESINYWFLNFIESVFICAVDLFIIISAYFMAYSKKRNLWKPIQLLVQVMLFSVVKHSLIAVVNSNFELSRFIASFIPANYFVILYIVVYIVSPYVNLIFENLDSNKRKMFILVLVLLFAVYPTAVDMLIEVTKRDYYGLSSIGMYGSQYGYSIVNFILCYCIGAYIRFESEKLDKIKAKKFIVVFISCVVIMTIWSVINDRVGYYTEKTAWEYCNPFVIMTGVCAVLLFRKIQIKNNKLINSLAKGSFTVYLLHSSFITHVDIEKFVNKNIFLLIAHMVISAVLIYLICWVGYLLYAKFEKAVFGVLKRNCKLPSLEI